MRNRFTACNWAALLGGMGAHHFYLGNIFTGFLYLAFCWTGLPLIVSFGEAIYFRWVISDDRFNERYNNHPDSLQVDNLSKLERLHNLKVKGAISDKEFQKQKAKLIA